MLLGSSISLFAWIYWRYKNLTESFFFSALMHQSNNVDSRRCYQCVKFLVTLAQKWVHLRVRVKSCAGVIILLRCTLLCMMILQWFFFFFFDRQIVRHNSEPPVVFPPGVLQPRITSRTCQVTGAGPYSGCRKRQVSTHVCRNTRTHWMNSF